MHKSHDPFERDLERANALENSRSAPREPELAADWTLKRELAGLGAAELPEAVKARARRAAVVQQRGPWLLGIAAALVAAVVPAVSSAPASGKRSSSRASMETVMAASA